MHFLYIHKKGARRKTQDAKCEIWDKKLHLI